VPTVAIIGPYRFHFYSSDRHESLHVYVDRDAATAKFWLDPVRLRAAQGTREWIMPRIER
jgi:hypothetical protein